MHNVILMNIRLYPTIIINLCTSLTWTSTAIDHCITTINILCTVIIINFYTARTTTRNLNIAMTITLQTASLLTIMIISLCRAIYVGSQLVVYVLVLSLFTFSPLAISRTKCFLSLSTIVLNSRDWSEIVWLLEISHFKINLAISFIR